MTKLVQLPTQSITPQQLDRDVTEEGITDLTNSIREHGIIEPLIVSELEGTYHLIAGKRRLIAAQRLNLPTVPCLLVEATHDQAIALTLHENLYREELNPVHEATFYLYMRDNLSMSNRDIAKLTGKGEAYISQRLQIQTWNAKLINALKESKISFSVARELSRLTNEKDLIYLLEHAIRDGVNYRTVQLWVRQLTTPLIFPSPRDDSSPDTPSQPSPYRTKVLCFWCNQEVDIDKILQIYLCPDCYRSILGSKQHQA